MTHLTELATAFVRSFIKDEEGATMVEYAPMLALIAVVCIAVVTLLGKDTNGTFDDVENAMP